MNYTYYDYAKIGGLLYTVFLVFIFYFWIWKRRGCIEVRIKTPYGERKRFVKPELDGEHLIVQKETKKLPEWKLHFKQTYRVKGLLFSHDAVDAHHESGEAVVWNFVDKTEEKPKLTKEQIKEFSQWEALRARYRTIGEKKRSRIEIVILIICIIILILLLKIAGYVNF